jgi:hypothetical protein
MQEDIFERLHYQSGLVAQGCWDELDDYDREAIRRFGNLVVAECARVADATSVSGPPRGCTYGNVILEHFGVTE